jgi:hypothetical protein
MILIEELLNKDNLHHAYVFEGDRKSLKNRLFGIIENDLQIETRTNPDFWYGEFKVFSLQDSKTVRNLERLQPVIGDKKIFVINSEFFTEEAQNSLLKVFEEPSVRTHFFIITVSANVLLPTLRSRLFIHSEKSSENNKILPDGFLMMKPPDRLTSLRHIIEEKDRSVALQVLNEMEVLITVDDFFRDSQRSFLRVLKEINRLRGYLKDRSPSVKLIMEHACLMIPVVNEK